MFSMYMDRIAKRVRSMGPWPVRNGVDVQARTSQGPILRFAARSLLRQSRLAIALWFVAAFGQRALAEIEPYQARIVTPRALVYSGPGEKFYPTAALVPGDMVEVYREEGGGWLGIRPPAGSFSLVPEKQLRVQDGDLAEVRDDSVTCRIGSQLSDKCNAVQVRLKRREIVEIVGRHQIDGETWCRIAPPAGEFRWIHAASVERAGPTSDTSEAAADSSAVIQASATDEAVAIQEESPQETQATAEAAPADAAEAMSSSESNDDSKWRASSQPQNEAATSAPPTATPATEQVTPPPLAPITPIPATASAPSAVPTTPPTAQPPAAANVAPVSPQPPQSAGFDVPRQLTEIELRLSRMASAPPQLWNTERLQRDTEQLLASAQSQAERDMVKATLTKIDRFTVLARRYQQGSQVASRQPTTPSQALANARQPTADGRYDAVGVLRPVVSKRPGAPQFALVDDRGQVLTFVTPTPDVNLQPYLGRRVGIAGNRGFIPEFNRAHVTAGRVTPLAQGMVR